MAGPEAQCWRCGYDLTGLDIGGTCPECNSAVFDSLAGSGQHEEAKSIVVWAIAITLGLQLAIAACLWGASRINAEGVWFMLTALILGLSSWIFAITLFAVGWDVGSRTGRDSMIAIGLASLVSPVVVLYWCWPA